MTILEQLAGYARERTEKAKQKRPLSTLRQQAFSMPKGSFAFENAIKKAGAFLLSVNVKRRLHPEGSSLVIFHIYRLQKSMRTPEQTVFPY